MSKNSMKLEKECMDWKTKFQRCNISLIELATDKQDRDDFSAKCGKQVEQLQKLLRALQHERTILYTTLRESNIASPQIPPLPQEPELMKVTVPPAFDQNKSKMDIMARNCAELKMSLATLQNEMKQIASKQEAKKNAEAVAAPATNGDAATKKKKNKNKKNKNKGCSLETPSEPSTDRTPDHTPSEQTPEPTPAEQTPEPTPEPVEQKTNGVKDDVVPTEDVQKTVVEPESSGIIEVMD